MLFYFFHRILIGKMVLILYREYSNKYLGSIFSHLFTNCSNWQLKNIHCIDDACWREPSWCAALSADESRNQNLNSQTSLCCGQTFLLRRWRLLRGMRRSKCLCMYVYSNRCKKLFSHFFSHTFYFYKVLLLCYFNIRRYLKLNRLLWSSQVYIVNF